MHSDAQDGPWPETATYAGHIVSDIDDPPDLSTDTPQLNESSCSETEQFIKIQNPGKV